MQTLNAAGPHVILMVVAWFATHSFEMNRPVVAWPWRGCHSWASRRYEAEMATPAGTTCSTEVLQLRIDAQDEMCHSRWMKIRWCGSTDRSTAAEQANRVQSGVSVVES